MKTALLPVAIGIATVMSSPMSWNNGSQLTAVTEPGLTSKAAAICAALAERQPCVIITPAGARVDPDVYCR